MTRFLVVDPDQAEAHQLLVEVTVAATDGAEPQQLLRPGTELAIPEAFDTETLLGVPVLDITAVTLDGRTWIPGRVAAIELVVGSGKRIDFEVRGSNLPKELSRAGANVITFHVSRLMAVANTAAPTRGGVEDEPTPSSWEERG